ncbi:malonyl-CoA decarboxylase [uncultured Jannaschia sp.]|uniref:malonyl-CoA decarboxylase n=1 Tax=uncultured Jannaschia sp. TaxID=293347 RepID=UPI0026298149|nr:malonyl-CoA decarboxylase [uncultured Jannaschia sp.]
MSLFADLLSNLFDRRLPGLPRRLADAERRDAPELARALMKAPGEDAQRLLAALLLERYDRLDDAEKVSMFLRLARELDIDAEAVRDTLDAYERTPDKDSYRAFATAAEPRRQELIRRVNRVTGATGRIVAIRADLLRLARGTKGEDADTLGALDEDFRHLLSSWFNRGFLVLRPISWETPANILEKIIAYEAVHEIGSWDGLRRRLQPPDRRCFGFFHPAMPDEPLIFVEVALTVGIPDSVQAILAEDRAEIAPEDADTACFYSISNCQPGLAGISFGNSLIKQVVADLQAALPGLKTFVTLSPIPSLMAWANGEGREREAQDPKALRRLAAEYLLNAKGRSGQPRDPVARFHLGNGALLHAIHASADISERGMTQSGGAMVNYLYDLSRIARNHERFAEGGEIVASGPVRGLLAGNDRQKGRGDAHA